MIEDQQNQPPLGRSQTGEANKPVFKKTKAVLSKTLQRVLGISGLIIVLLIIAGGALLASHTWNPSWNPFNPPPQTEQVIKQKIIDKIKK